MSKNNIPPHSEQAEAAVLGSIMIDSGAFAEVYDLVKPADFYNPANAIIFQAMESLFMNNTPIDSLTIFTALTNEKKMEAIGGNVYLTDLMTAVFTSANCRYYAKTVRDKSILRGLMKAAMRIEEVAYDEANPTSEIVEQAQNFLYAAINNVQTKGVATLKSVLNERYEAFAEMQSDPFFIDKNRISTGYESFDTKIGGFNKGDLVVIAARPSMGKTALALNLSQNIAKNGKKVIIFSLEMSKEQLTDRMIASHSGLDQKRMVTGQLTDEEFGRMAETMEYLSKSQIFIDDVPAETTLNEIRSKAQRVKMQGGLDLMVIDYLQLIYGQKGGNRVQEVSEISRGLKAMAREMDIPIVALAQLSRAVEQRPDKRPIMSDLRDSGSIEQDADVIAMLYRDEYYNDFSETPGITNVFIRKNRHGSTAKIDLKFDGKTQKFHDIIS